MNGFSDSIVKLNSEISQIFKYFNKGNSPSSLLINTATTEALTSAYIQIAGEYKYWAGASFANFDDREIQTLPKTCAPNEFWPILKQKMSTTHMVVDLGCGVRPNFFLGQDVTVCVELFSPYLKYLKDTHSGEKIITIKEDVLTFLKRQPARSIETIVVTDLIEHLSKNDGYSLIQEIERTVRKQALVVTPKGFMPQHVGEFDDEGWGFTGNILQNHVSGWEIDDFQNWEVMVSENYYTEVEHPEGVLGCVFFPSSQEHHNLHIILEPFADENRMLKIASKLFKLLNRYCLENNEDSIGLTLPLIFSPKSISISPNLVMPTAEVEYVSFNWEVNNYFYVDANGEPKFIPGTMSNRIQSIKAKKVLILSEKARSDINYREIISQDYTMICLDENFVAELELYVKSGPSYPQKNLSSFVNKYAPSS